MNLRQLARDKPCQVRIPGVCNRDNATTVLAHYRLLGLSGMSMKAPDVIGAWSCSACHDEVDGRSRHLGIERTSIRLMHAEGVMRTLEQLIKDGVLA